MEKFEIGTPGYVGCGSDVYPVTLVRQSDSGKTIWVRYESFEGDIENGHDYFGHQVWKITPNPKGRIERFNWSNKIGRYSQGGVPWNTVKLGKWFAHQDPHF
jgi:cytochrome c2